VEKKFLGYYGKETSGKKHQQKTAAKNISKKQQQKTAAKNSGKKQQ
jgi:hypothetical protein